MRSGRLLDLSGYGDCRARFQSEVPVLFLSLLRLQLPALYGMLISVTMNSGRLARVRWVWLGYVLEMLVYLVFLAHVGVVCCLRRVWCCWPALVG